MEYCKKHNIKLFKEEDACGQEHLVCVYCIDEMVFEQSPAEMWAQIQHD